MLFHNVIGKNDQLVVYASRLLNIVEQNSSTILAQYKERL